MLGLSAGAAFQEEEYIGSTINFGNKNLYSSLNTNFNYTCFPKGTKISLVDGGIKNIEEIKVGDKVLSFNESTKEIEEKEVEKVFIREAKKMLEINLSNGKVIKPTPDHEFYLNGKWVEAKDLKVHDELLDLELEKVRIISIEELAGDRVYNFTVEDNHNYFAENILVHNTDYDEKRVVLELQAYSVINDSSMNVEDNSENQTREIELNRINQLEAMSKSANDLIQITKTDTALIIPVKNFALQRIEEIKRIIDRRVEAEKMELVYNRRQGQQVREETNKILNALINSNNNEIQDFEYLVKLGYGGKYTMKELERDK